MDFTKILQQILEEYRVVGLIIIVLLILSILSLPVVLPYIFNKGNKAISDNINTSMEHITEKITDTMATQNTALLDTLKESQNKMIDTQMTMFNYMISTLNKPYEIHNIGLSKREEVTPDIMHILKELVQDYNASRAAVIEFHNSKENINGLPFLWYDIQFEFLTRGVSEISTKVKDIQASILSEIISRLKKDDYIILEQDDIAALEDTSPVLYSHLQLAHATGVVYGGIWSKDNSKLAGILLVEYQDDNVIPVDRVPTDYYLSTLLKLGTLLEAAPIDNVLDENI